MFCLRKEPKNVPCAGHIRPPAGSSEQSWKRPPPVADLGGEIAMEYPHQTGVCVCVSVCVCLCVCVCV